MAFDDIGVPQPLEAVAPHYCDERLQVRSRLRNRYGVVRESLSGQFSPFQRQGYAECLYKPRLFLASEQSDPICSSACSHVALIGPGCVQSITRESRKALQAAAQRTTGHVVAALPPLENSAMLCLCNFQRCRESRAMTQGGLSQDCRYITANTSTMRRRELCEHPIHHAATLRSTHCPFERATGERIPQFCLCNMAH